MSAESIQKSNLAWRLRHLGKNLSEWIQLQLSRGEPDSQEPPPTFEFPEWIGRLLFWVVIAVGIVWLAWLILQIADRYLTHRRGKSPRQPIVQTVSQPKEHAVADWLRQAKQFEQQSNWGEACRALYLAALQLLHDRDWIPHQLSRTDGEYLQAIRKLKQSRPLQLLIRTHERSHFGAAPLTVENLRHCRQAYEELEKR